MLCLYIAVSAQPRRRIPFKRLCGCHSRARSSSCPTLVAQSVALPPAPQIYICCDLCDRGTGKHYLLGSCRVSVFRGISKYKSIPLKTYNGSLTFCQGRGGGAAEKTTGGGAGDRREGWWVLPQCQICVSECVGACVSLCVVRLSQILG